MRGRPLRFLGGVLGCWAMARTAMLWPEAAPLPALIRAVAPPAVAAVPTLGRMEYAAPSPVTVALPIALQPRSRAVPSIAPSRRTDVPVPPSPDPESADPMPQREAADAPGLPPPLPPAPPPRAPSRLAGSVWMVGRGDGDHRSVPGVQLGGSQAGVRVAYAFGAARRVALAGRVSTPLAGRGREAALGVEWRPLDAPVRLVAERRWSLDGGRGGPTLMAVAGVNPSRVGPLVAEAYLQAGAIARGRIDGFADGAARVSVPIATGAVRLDLGAGAWGGAQPGAARLDLGPSLGVGVPVGARRMRIALDWRQRVAGRARPASGPALSIGSDF